LTNLRLILQYRRGRRKNYWAELGKLVGVKIATISKANFYDNMQHHVHGGFNVTKNQKIQKNQKSQKKVKKVQKIEKIPENSRKFQKIPET
jgi:hypothetical protein